MPARILPDVSKLRAMVEQGLTHQEIADLLSRETGYPIRRSTVSAALHRANETQSAKRYDEEIPWRVRQEHQTHYAVRMLRLLGRRRAGIVNSAEADRRLDSWLAQLAAAGAVVTYVEDTPEGFFYIAGRPDANGIPVQRDYEEFVAGTA
jgi:hypothetical protein